MPLPPLKSGCTTTGAAILFEVAENGVNFIDEVEITADEAYSETMPKMGRPTERVDAAEAFIRNMLKDGKMLATECEAKLEAAGFKKSTIKKAKKNVGVLSEKAGIIWSWRLVDGTEEKSQAEPNA